MRLTALKFLLGFLCLLPLMAEAANPLGRTGAFLGNTTARPTELGAVYNFPAAYAFREKDTAEYTVNFLFNYLPAFQQKAYVSAYSVLPYFTGSSYLPRPRHSLMWALGEYDAHAYTQAKAEATTAQEFYTQDTIYLALAYAYKMSRHWGLSLGLRGENEEQEIHRSEVTDENFTYTYLDNAFYRLQGIFSLAYRTTQQVLTLSVGVPAINVHARQTKLSVSLADHEPRHKDPLKVTYPWTLALGYFLDATQAAVPFSLTAEVHLQTPLKQEEAKTKMRASIRSGLRIEGRRLGYLMGLHFTSKGDRQRPAEFGLSAGIQLKRVDGEPQLGLWAKRYNFAKAINEIGILVSLGN